MPDHVYEFFSSLFRGTMVLREGEKEDRNDFVSILKKLRNEEKSNNRNQVGKFYTTHLNLRGNRSIFKI